MTEQKALPGRSIAVLICAFNRRTKTLACLDRVFRSNLPADARLTVYLVDDGSTDGTSAAVANMFPQVRLIQGSGDLYWSGGIRRAWSAAASDDPDYFVWLNDDVETFEDAFAQALLASTQVNDAAILCGAACSPTDGVLTYGGRNALDGPPVEPNGQLQPCRFINGNFVLVPRTVHRHIGGLDPIFVHDIGDYDYGLRAQDAGHACYVLPRPIGYCARNEFVQKWRSPEIPLVRRFRLLYSPLARPHPSQYFVFARRHFGLISALRSWTACHVRALFPRLPV